jgi:hypothetical protein
MKLATLLLFLAITSAAADHHNGRAWRDFSNDAKTTYVIGLADGIVEGATSGCSKLKFKSQECFEASLEAVKSALGKPTVGEIVEGVNDFYRDPANVQIPILNAMKYFQLRVQGTIPTGWRKL